MCRVTGKGSTRTGGGGGGMHAWVNLQGADPAATLDAWPHLHSRAPSIHQSFQASTRGLQATFQGLQATAAPPTNNSNTHPRSVSTLAGIRCLCGTRLGAKGLPLLPHAAAGRRNACPTFQPHAPAAAEPAPPCIRLLEPEKRVVGAAEAAGSPLLNVPCRQSRWPRPLFAAATTAFKSPPSSGAAMAPSSRLLAVALALVAVGARTAAAQCTPGQATLALTAADAASSAYATCFARVDVAVASNCAVTVTPADAASSWTYSALWTPVDVQDANLQVCGGWWR